MGSGAGPPGLLHVSHQRLLPAVLPTPPLPPQQGGILTHRVGLHSQGTGGNVTETGCVSRGPGAGGKKNTCSIGSCLWAVPAVATGFPRPARRCLRPGLRNKLRCPARKAALAADARGRAGCTPLRPVDLVSSPGPVPLPLDTLETRSQARAGLETSSKKHLLMLGLCREDSSPPRPPTPSMPGGWLRASGWPLAARPTKLPGLDLVVAGGPRRPEGPRPQGLSSSRPRPG